MNRIIDIPYYGEEDGVLCVFEPELIPGFSVERIFYIYDVPENSMRADHVCMNATILLVPINGSVTVSVEYKGVTQEYVLDKKNRGLLIEATSWVKTYDFSAEAVLMCLSNKKYKDCEYINDYEDYKRKVIK